MSLARKLFSFEGRLRRRDYWVLSILLGMLVFVVGELIVVYGFGPEHGIFEQTTGVFSPVQQWKTLVVSLVMLWPGLAITAKRAHDRDNSARVPVAVYLASTAWSLVTVFFPTVLAGQFLLALLIGALQLAALLYLLITLGFLDGTPGPNRFGESPKER